MGSALCGGIGYVRQLRMTCPVCHVDNARVVMEYPDSPYYGPTWRCAECGDAWADGYRLARPFERGWRDKAKARIIAEWDRACPESPVLAHDYDGTPYWQWPVDALIGGEP